MIITNLNGRRKGQVLHDFLVWIKQKKGKSGRTHCCKMADVYYLEDKELDSLWEEYIIDMNVNLTLEQIRNGC